MGLRPFPCILALATACYDPAKSTDGSASDGSGTQGSSGGGSTTQSTTMTSDSMSATGASATTTATTATGTDASSSGSDGADSSSSAADSSSSGGSVELCNDPTVQQVYLDFDGATVTMGVVDNGPAYISATEALIGEWDPYADDDIDQIVDIVRGHFAAYSICITTEVPTTLDYTVVMVTTETAPGSEMVVSFIHPYDCGNSNLDDFEGVFLHPSLGLPPITKAIAISAALGHRLGLDPVDEPSDLMNRYVGTTNNGATFTDVCTALAGNNAPIYCESLEGPGCNPSEQNSHAYLLATLGAAPG